VQHQDDFLLVRPVTTIVDDERRRHQELLLKALMRMHLQERSLERVRAARLPN
jgi:hypothetical protein